MRTAKGVVLVLLVSGMVWVGCSKENTIRPGKKKPVENDYVLLYEKVVAGDKSVTAVNEETAVIDFSPYGSNGELKLVTDGSGELLRSEMTREVYDLLYDKLENDRLSYLPKAIIEKALLLKKEGYDFWKNHHYIPPMSRAEFDRRMNACEDKSTSAGVLLCAARVLTDALVDCINSTDVDEDIHCW